MADSPILPGARSWVDAQGRPLPVEFFRFLRDLVAYLRQIDTNSLELQQIIQRLEALESAETDEAVIRGLYSVFVSGSLEDDLVDIQLVGDSPSPGPYSFYSTNPEGTKGWRRPEPSETLNPYADYLVDENGDYLVDENGNFLTSDDGFPINPDYLPDHNNLNGLDGGTTGEYYHMTSAEHSFLSSVVSGSPIDVTGSRGGNAALASLLTALATLGLITDSTTA